MHGDFEGRDGFVVLPILLHPGGRGQIRLRSTDPFDPPVIDDNILSDPRDIKILIEGMLILCIGIHISTMVFINRT